MTRRYIGASVGAMLLATLGVSAQSARPQAPPGGMVECTALVGLALDGGTTITAATLVSNGSVTVSPTSTVAGMPAFCRVQGVSRPSADSHIVFEVWLPDRPNWNGRFLSTGEGGFAGTPNFTRNGLDGGMDEIVRRGYATAGTDTGHTTTDEWWAIGHPEKAADYLYRAKHVTTVAAKAIEVAWLELSEAGGDGISGARKADEAARASADFLHSPSFWMGLALLPLVYLLVLSLIGLIGSATWSDDVRAGLAGSLISAVIGGLIGFYYGQSTTRNRTPAA